ncbi:MAG: RsmB/NOP family class I SAM-dependent RNA methyltransferase [Synergistaceae bacterium]|nr:RsmB/NOP family class I SAM-dependent RNA methyltransferase [Synergistaceae bacterium]
MRGIEAALKILTQNPNEGAFASELLRKLADREKMKATDISLASSLVYIFMRRRELWEKIAGDYIRSQEKLPREVYIALIMGTGGILELRRFSEGVLINGILEQVKRNKAHAKYSGLINAVLRKIKEAGSDRLEKFRKSPTLEGRAMWAGVPVWTLPAWMKSWTRPELNDLFEAMNQSCCSSIRVSPCKSNEMLKMLDSQEIHYHESELAPGVLRLNESFFPASVPGFKEGLFTLQSEGSVIAASIVKKFYQGNGLILDMCSGRGVKAGQILQENVNARIECWELSEKKSKSAAGELSRLGVRERAVMKTGDALTLEPDSKPAFIVLDAPCSCSGTWNRKPESKWRLTWPKLDGFALTQKRLLERALTLCDSGSFVLYITCSLFKQENENVIAEVLAKNPDCVEMPLDFKSKEFRKGRPWGMYILPVNAWLDGFYCALIMKK